MYFGWTLLKLHRKRYVKLVPAILAETLLFALIVLGTGIYASKALYQEKAIGVIKVGVVAPADEKTGLLVSFVESMDSMEDTVSFVLLTQEKAREQLKSGEIYGAVVIPDGLVESIISGENIPARIMVGNFRARAETEVFVQLTGAGAKLLATAQAGIYAADALCREMAREELIPRSEDYLNRAYLEYALGRSMLLKEREVDALSGASPVDYYGISLFLAFLSFVGLSFGKTMQVVPSERDRILHARGVGAVRRYLTDAAAFAGVFSLLGTLLCIPVAFWLSERPGSMLKPSFWWLGAAAVCFSAGIFLRMLFQLTGNSPGGLGAAFVFLLASMTVSGIFIPREFLPVWAERLGGLLPYQTWMEELAKLLQGRAEGDIVLQTVRMAAVFSAVGAAAAAYRHKRLTAACHIGICRRKERGHVG